MADYKYSHLGFAKMSLRECHFDKLSEREAKVKLECKKRISDFSWSKLDKKLIWLHIKNTSQL